MLNQTPKIHPIYTVTDIKQMEQTWFAAGNDSFGLMSQAAYLMADRIYDTLVIRGLQGVKVLVFCGFGNNGGDGYLVARYLMEKGVRVRIIALTTPVTPDCIKARAHADGVHIASFDHLDDELAVAGVIIDAIFGAGLDRLLDSIYIDIINKINAIDALKIAIDLPSGLHADTGVPLPTAVMADITLCILALKLGLLTGQGKSYAGQVLDVPLIPVTGTPTATLDTRVPQHPTRYAHAHKGDCGHIAIIGGHPNMGGAVMMAGEAAMAVGAGKVTIICHASHHVAILAHSPNVMVQDIDVLIATNELDKVLDGVDGIAFGMGLGRDDWAKQCYQKVLKVLKSKDFTQAIMDADALYWLAKYPEILPDYAIGTPHAAEAGRLLGITTENVENNRLHTLHTLAQRYGGNWVLKGAGTLTLQNDKVAVCPYGNASMATAGMGDVLSGVVAALSVQGVSVADCVNIHARAGDALAERGQVLATEMARALAQTW